MYRFLPVIHAKVVSETVLGAVVNDKTCESTVLIHDSTEKYKVQYSTVQYRYRLQLGKRFYCLDYII